MTSVTCTIPLKAKLNKNLTKTLNPISNIKWQATYSCGANKGNKITISRFSGHLKLKKPVESSRMMLNGPMILKCLTCSSKNGEDLKLTCSHPGWIILYGHVCLENLILWYVQWLFLSGHWTKSDLTYCFPPFCLIIGRVLQRTQASQPTTLMIVPQWKTILVPICFWKCW